jgi:hypothetical protein
MQRLALFKPAALALLAITVPAVATQPALSSAPPGFSPVSVSGTPSDEPSSVYVRVTQPKASVELVLPPEQASAASTSYRVATYLVNCQAKGVKYESVRNVDAASHLSLSSLSMPKTVWHQPRAGSVEAGALSRACEK